VDRDDGSESTSYLETVRRLARLHRDLRGEQRFLISIGDEAQAALLGLTLLPLEAAIVDLGRLADSKEPLHNVRA
jgi:hypothetical protein